MKRELAIKLNDDATITIPVRVSMRACRLYRDEFQSDLIGDLTALHSAATRGMEAAMLQALRGKNINFEDETAVYEEIIGNADLLALTESKPLTFEQMETAGRILWAMAKNDDDKIAGYVKWIDSFDAILPMREIVAALYGLWALSSTPTIEIKNE